MYDDNQRKMKVAANYTEYDQRDENMQIYRVLSPMKYINTRYTDET